MLIKHLVPLVSEALAVTINNPICSLSNHFTHQDLDKLKPFLSCIYPDGVSNFKITR